MHAAEVNLELALPGAGVRATQARKLSETPSTRHVEILRAILLQFALSGALINRNSIELAKGIVEVLIWSAEHARDATGTSCALAQDASAEWKCPGCAEPVPANFDLCWNCERAK